MASASEIARTVRPLGSFERAQILTGERFPYNLVVLVRLSGVVPPDRLRAALDEIQRRTPLLRARVDGSGRRAVFRLAQTRRLALRLEAGAPDDWARRVERELADGFDARRGPLARAVLVDYGEGGEGPRGEVLFTFHHAIADGVGVARLLKELFALCAGDSSPLAEAADALPLPEAAVALPLPEAADALPPSVDERFPRRCRTPGGGGPGLAYLLRQGWDEIAYRWRRRRRPSPPPVSGACRVLTAALSPDETKGLQRACRDLGVSLTAALEAAMLLAVARLRYGEARLPQRYFVFPVLRPYLDPPIEPGLFASYTVALRFTLTVGAKDELWSLAAAIGRQIGVAVQGDDKFFASIWSPLSMKAILGQSRHRMGTTAVSFVGPLTLTGAARALASDVHTFVSNFPLGPEYAAQARIFGGRLVWDIVYLDGDLSEARAWDIAREMKTLLLHEPDPAAGGAKA